MAFFGEHCKTKENVFYLEIKTNFFEKKKERLFVPVYLLQGAEKCFGGVKEKKKLEINILVCDVERTRI